MNIEVFRYNSSSEHTNSVVLIDGKFECYGLEDEQRSVKIKGETRIPDGIYRLNFRKVGGFHNRYLRRYGKDFHKGMIQIKDVPNFRYILIHIGNNDKDTAGCFLVGQTQARGENHIGASRLAYESFYPKVRDALIEQRNVTILFRTIDIIS